MAAKVTLEVLKEGSVVRHYDFRTRTLCSLGRAQDCFLHLPDELLFLDVSRHHCLFDIDPPDIRVRDLGSRNGTFVNGRLIGQREHRNAPEAVQPADMPEAVLHNGDYVAVASLVIRVGVSEEAAEPVERTTEGELAGCA